jgi:hypothetical protein
MTQQNPLSHNEFSVERLAEIRDRAASVLNSCSPRPADCTPLRWAQILQTAQAVPKLIAAFEASQARVARLEEVALAAEDFCNMAPPWGHVDRQRRLDRLQVALIDARLWLARVRP